MKAHAKSINFSAIAITQLRRLMPWGRSTSSGKGAEK